MYIFFKCCVILLLSTFGYCFYGLREVMTDASADSNYDQPADPFGFYDKNTTTPVDYFYENLRLIGTFHNDFNTTTPVTPCNSSTTRVDWDRYEIEKEREKIEIERKQIESERQKFELDMETKLQKVKTERDALELDRDLFRSCQDPGHECKVTVREVVGFYVHYFIDNDPSTDKLTKCNAWDNCTWYVQEREKFSQNPRRYVDDVLRTLNVRFDDQRHKFVVINHVTGSPPPNVRSIKDLPRALKLFWFLYTIKNQPLDDARDHPSFVGWKDMLLYFEFTQNIDSLGFAQLLTIATKRLNREAHSKHVGNLGSKDFVEQMLHFTMCVRCLVEERQFVTPKFEDDQSGTGTLLVLLTYTTTSPAITTPRLLPLVSKMKGKYARLFTYVDKYGVLPSGII